MIVDVFWLFVAVIMLIAAAAAPVIVFIAAAAIIISNIHDVLCDVEFFWFSRTKLYIV